MPRTEVNAGAAPAAAAVTVRVPAKLNLHLRCGPRRPDGYHELTTVFQAVSLLDEVTAEPAERLSVVVRGEGSGLLPRGRDNHAVRAARLLARAGRVSARVRLTLDKGIPVAGGMAGGSADAAATLRACDALWGLNLPAERLFELAAQLGSDVPFALHGRTALGTGRGEQLAPVLTSGTFHWVLGLDTEGLETPAVYAELDRLRAEADLPPAPGPDGVLAALRAGDPVALGRVLHNDLTPAAVRLRPRLGQVLDAGRELGVAGALLCGSGATCAFLARDEPDAVRIASALAGLGVCRTVRRASGPVAGAQVCA